ncbi:MAG: C25 family cysteine peptidase, partial [Bacteroidales bacterium]|nr:C25 family cysteine peptidase [Bacteroidales bacterium]
HQTSIRFEVNAAELIAVNTDNGKAFIATSDNAPLMLQEGCPEMFFLTTAFIIPDTGGSELEIAYGAYQEFDNIEIAPSKGNLLRSVDPATVPYVKGEIYQKDGFYPGTLAALREPFIMRDVRGQLVDVYPVQYNPVTKVLRVYAEITVTVTNTPKTGINELTNQKRNATIDPTFSDMYSRLFINNSVMQSRGYPTEEEGELLIICHSAWVDDMKPYVDWKRSMGRKTTIVPTSAISPLTKENIKTYITNFYNDPNNNLAFVLLVGDHPQLPPHQVGSTRSDVEYGKLTGGDDYLEVLIGRMSAETPAHVQTQVQRTITYERDLTTDDTWVSAGIGVARNEGNGNGHDGGEADYVHMNNIRTRMMTYGYDPVWQEYDGGCPGIPNTTAAQINQRLDAGASVLNYCNHGSPTGWSVANYSNTHVNQLQNVNKLPYLFLVACNNGEFGPWQYNTSDAVCLSEAFMRHTYNNQPAGAIAAFGATISISWQPTMTAQDEFVNIYLDLPSPYGTIQPGTKRTIAGAMLNATQKMIMVHSGSTADYNSWLVFGDPTLNFRTKTPQAMTVSHLPVLLLGMNSLTVNCDAEGAVAAVTYIDNDDEVIILGTATVTGGIAEVTFAEPLSTPMDLILTVTGFNKVAYQAPIQAIPASGPYVVHDGYAVTGGGELTYISTNEEIEVTLKNVGSDPTNGTLNVTIACDDPQLTIVNGTAQHTASIAPDGTATVKFNVTVANDIADGKTFPLDFTVKPAGDPWESKLPLKAYAPNLKLDNVLIDGVEGGSLVPGSLVIITTVVKNDGGADTYKLIADLEMSSPYLTIACDGAKSRAPQNLPAGESMNFDFYVICDPAMPYGYTTDFNLMLAAQYGIEKTIPFDASCSGADGYCSSGSQNCGSSDKFTSVQLVKTSEPTVYLINNTNGACASDGYQDYTSTNVALEPGAQYTIKVKVGFSSQQVGGWFDLNGNNVFDSNEKLITLTCSTSGTEYSTNFTVPTDVVSGTSRFRLVCKWSGAPDACGNSSYGQTHDYTITLPELYARVQNVVAVLNETENTISVTWSAPAEGTPTGYNVYRNNELLNATPLTTLSFTEENITPGIYAYNVTALYAGNKESFAEMSNVICNILPELACEPPVNLEVTVQGNTAILTWDAPEVIEGELLGYDVYRDEDKINDEPITALEYQDKDRPDGTYVYQVNAIYEHCESDLTEGVSITIEIGACEPPFDLVGVAEGKTAILTWGMPEAVEGAEPLGFNIYRDGASIEELFTGMEYRDEDLTNGTYIYKVTAVYELCESVPTDEVTVEIDETNICTITVDSFQIFPNPTSGELKIENGELKIDNINVFDVMGRKQLSTFNAQLSTLDISSLPTGVYFIQIDTEYGNVTKKVVKN